MKDFVKIFLNNDFLITYAPWMSWQELKRGLGKKFIDEHTVVNFSLNRLSTNSTDKHFELSSLQSNGLHAVSNLLDELITLENRVHDDGESWLYLLMQLLYNHKNFISDPLSLVEKIYANFDYPESISTVVRYMPVPDGQMGSEEELYKNWKDTLNLMQIKLSKNIKGFSNGY